MTEAVPGPRSPEVVKEEARVILSQMTELKREQAAIQKKYPELVGLKDIEKLWQKILATVGNIKTIAKIGFNIKDWEQSLKRSVEISNEIQDLEFKLRKLAQEYGIAAFAELKTQHDSSISNAV